MKILRNLISIFILYIAFSLLSSTSSYAQQTSPNSNNLNTKIYVAEVVDATEMSKYSYADHANNQKISIEIKSGEKIGTRLDTTFNFPNNYFKSPLRRGDQLLVEVPDDIKNINNLRLVSMYRQNNLLMVILILFGMFLLISGFKSNNKYLKVFIITIISGIIVLFFYRKRTDITFGGVVIWQLLSGTLFAYYKFKKRVPTIILAMSIILNQFLALGTVFIFKNINTFDTGFFNLFFTSISDARRIMIYIFALLVSYPISMVFAEQIISDAIQKKREENDILKVALVSHVMRSNIRTLNKIFLIFFGYLFAISIGIIAIGSKEKITLQILNSAPLSLFLSSGLIILLNLLLFVPLVSFLSGVWLGRLESYQLVTDENLRQLEL